MEPSRKMKYNPRGDNPQYPTPLDPRGSMSAAGVDPFYPLSEPGGIMIYLYLVIAFFAGAWLGWLGCALMVMAKRGEGE